MVSPELKAFYQAIQAWIASEMVTNRFDRHCGLCMNLMRYLRQNNVDYQSMCRISAEQNLQFQAAGLDRIYPFDNDESYYRDNRHSMYENPKRLAWIKEHAA